MKRMHKDFVPHNAKIIHGERGGEYFIDEDGEKIHITSGPRTPSRSFKARRGAFLRWLEAQNHNA